MDIHDIRQELKLKSIYDIQIRVTFYARVSSEKDEQLNSLDNQISYYKNLIQNNPNWKYVEGYIDEGISGISTKKRECFHNMIEDAKLDKFDLIITKEISRFARNTLDSIKYTRELLNCGVGVFFQNDNINTFDEDSELRLTIMSGIAQDELRKLSSRIKFGHQQAIQNGVVLGNSKIWGYTKENKKLVIDEEQAKIVRELFELYSTNRYSLKQIENIFWEKGYRNNMGNKIAHNTMSNIISNPKYKGYYVGNKVKVIDMFTKKQKFLSENEWVMFKDETGDIVPAIVSEELWTKCNEILSARSADVKQRNGKCNHDNLLTGKLICTHCNKTYYRRSSQDRKGNHNSKWICSGKINNGANSCKSFAIYENEIKSILFEILSETKDYAKELIEEYINIVKKIEVNDKIDKNIEIQNKKIQTAIKKKSKLLEYNIDNKISDNDFILMNKKCEEEILNAQNIIFELENEKSSVDKVKNNINEIRQILQNATDDAENNLIDKNFVDKYIDEILVTPIDETTMKLEIKIFTNQVLEKTITMSQFRMGHMSKIILPKRNIIFYRNIRTVDNHIKSFCYNVSISIDI